MKSKISNVLVSVVVILTFTLSACATPAPEPTNTPLPTSTNTPEPTATFTPTKTPRPTATPNLAATKKAEDFQAEVQSYFDQGWLSTTTGTMKEIDDFSYEWAQLGWYDFSLTGVQAADFFISGHLKWSSAYKNADVSGCGYVFSLQQNGDHYAIFLDRSKLLFLVTSDGRGRSASPTRGNGRVKFENPAVTPAEADFTVIVNDSYVYAVVDGELIAEYTLAQSRGYKGHIALTLLSGTNKDYGTRCEMTDVHIWTPK